MHFTGFHTVSLLTIIIGLALELRLNVWQFVLTVPLTNSLQIGHFLMAGAQSSQQVKWPQGRKTMDTFSSTQITHRVWFFRIVFSCLSEVISVKKTLIVFQLGVTNCKIPYLCSFSLNITYVDYHVQIIHHNHPYISYTKVFINMIHIHITFLLTLTVKCWWRRCIWTCIYLIIFRCPFCRLC